jgi:branched-chain amino acid transport system ATP-binding protein
MALLEIKNVSMYFGGLAAVNDLTVNVRESEILGLIGPNGAGKTTLFNLISGLFSPTHGEIQFKNDIISGAKPHEIAKKGIGRTFQQSNLFMDLSVFDNVFIGFHMNYRTGLFSQFFHTPAVRKEEETIARKTLDILDLMGLHTLKDEVAKNLPHGYQRILGICVALSSEPQLLLLDEPLTGMNPRETQIAIDLIRQIKNKGITIVIVEHDMKAVVSLCDRIAVLNFGKKLVEGLPKEIMKNDEVIEAYLGKKGA